MYQSSGDSSNKILSSLNQHGYSSSGQSSTPTGYQSSGQYHPQQSGYQSQPQSAQPHQNGYTSQSAPSQTITTSKAHPTFFNPTPASYHYDHQQERSACCRLI